MSSAARTTRSTPMPAAKRCRAPEFVPVKSAEQQATLMLHKTRDLLVKQRTMSVNALRGHLSEFGIIAAKGIGRVDELLDLVESDTTLPNAARASAKVLAHARQSDRRSGGRNHQRPSAK